MPKILFRSTGVEELLDEVETVLIRDINSALEEVYQRREQADMDRATRRNVDYVPVTAQSIPPTNFHTGNFPSLVLEEVPKDDYPYIVTTIEDYSPDPEDPRQDHVNVYRDALAVHCLASAEPDEGSEIVFRRAVRMGEAVFLSLMSDTEMSRRLGAISNPTRGQHSIPWTYKHKGRGENWWFQAVGMSYAIKSYTTFNQ